MSDIQEIVDNEGQVRKLGWLRPTESNKMARSPRLGLKDYLESTNRGLIPRSQWTPVSRRSMFGPEFINDQKSSSGCSGWSGAQALMRLRRMYGMSFQKLSGAFLYSQVNGNKDNGSVILDVDNVLTRDGTCLESEFNFPKIFDRDVPPNARKTAERFRLLQSLTLDTFDEAATATILGFVVCYPLQVGSNFEKFDNGVAGYAKGYGNHAVHGFGLVNVNGIWCLETGNTWSRTWGPFRDGTVLVSEKAFAGLGGSDDSYCQIAPAADPQEENQPPSPLE